MSNRQRVVTILTLIVVAMWVVSAVVRLFVEWPEAGVLDNLMPVVGTFWFITSAISRNGNGAKSGTGV